MIEYGLVGKNISHSYSKYIHESLSPINYELISLKTDEEFLEILKQDFKFLNVTMPFKKLAFNHSDFLSEEAKNTEVVNTIIKVGGKIYGYNTDVFGFEYLLKENNIDVKHKKCLIFGTGATSKTVKYVLNKNGALEIKFLSRNPDNINSFSYEDGKNFKDFDIIINTTPIGSFANQDQILQINPNNFENVQYYIDVIYNPLRTKTAIDFKINKQIKTINGLKMLIAQAAKSQEIFFKKESDTKILRELYLKLFKKCFNIALIGHPLAGKTTIGKKLAEKLNLEFIDIDLKISEKIGTSIPEFFKNKGEELFRKEENKVIEESLLDRGRVISTGGGSVLDIQNVKNLMSSCVMINIQRNINSIQDNEFFGRPLSKDRNELNLIIDKRKNLYKLYEDASVENFSTIDETVKEIIRKL